MSMTILLEQSFQPLLLVEQKFTETAFYRWIDATMYGMGVREKFATDDRGANCLENVYAIGDAINGLYLNVSAASAS